MFCLPKSYIMVSNLIKDFVCKLFSIKSFLFSALFYVLYRIKLRIQRLLTIFTFHRIFYRPRVFLMKKGNQFASLLQSFESFTKHLQKLMIFEVIEQYKCLLVFC